MKLSPDDPRLTAYALGELPESERKEVEAELEQLPECRQAVDEIHQAAKALSEELAGEPCGELSPEQRETIEAQSSSPKVIRLTRRQAYSTLWLAAAACILFLFVLLFIDHESSNGRLSVASYERPTLSPVTPQFQEPGDKNKAVIAEQTAPGQDFWKNQNPGLGLDSKSPTADQNSTIVYSYFDSSATLGGAAVGSSTFSLDVQPDASDVVSGGKSSANTLQRGTTLHDGAVVQNFYRVEAGGVGGGGGGGVGGYSGNGIQTPSAWNGSPTPQSQPPAPPVGNVYSVNAVGYVAVVTDLDVDDAAKADLEKNKDSRVEVGQRFRYEVQGQETARYPRLVENQFLNTRNVPLSTFSVDVDTASYANTRRFLNEGRMPPHDAVRVEELVNYFTYNYSPPRGDDPFAANIEVAGCPWNSDHRLVRVGLKGREIARDRRPPSNFVFLIDVSGSMQPAERLPLIKQALRQLVRRMTENDRVAIVVYASEAGLKLESTRCSEKERILQAIDELGAGGSTNGGDGIRQAYRVAEEHFIRGGVNRVLLCTDGDFNVGMTDQNDLVHMIQEKARSGVFLTTLGVGTDNYKDALMMKLADKGNGNYHYLDTLEEAQKVLIDQMNGTLVTIAKDVKIQIEFNPTQVNAYRLIGYEKRMLRKEDFNNDAKDAGEIGAGHTVTALYEIVPAGRDVPGTVDELKYQKPSEEKGERYASNESRELLTLKLRYKQPDGDRSRLLEFPVTDSGKGFGSASTDFRFAVAVASFGMLLRNSEYKGTASYRDVLDCASRAKGSDEEGYRAEFINLVQKARSLDGSGEK